MKQLDSIYTEKIHHVDCVWCDAQKNTNDDSHQLTKYQAAQSFLGCGWIYKFKVGWLCPECKK